MNFHIKLSADEPNPLELVEILNVSPKESDRISVKFSINLKPHGREFVDFWDIKNDIISGLNVNELKTYIYNNFPRDNKERAIAALADYLNDNDITYTMLKNAFENEELELGEVFSGGIKIEYDDEKYLVIVDASEAAEYYEELVKNGIENEGECLEEYIYITETDRRLWASDFADSRVSEMGDSEILSATNSEDEYEKIENEYNEKIQNLQEELGNIPLENEEVISQLEENIDNLETQKDEKLEEFVEEKKREASEQIYDKWYDGLSDPVNFLINEQGLYSDVSQLVDNNVVSVDYEKMASDIVENYGLEDLMEIYTAANEVQEIPKFNAYVGKV